MKTILAVDDTASVLQLVKLTLNAAGYAVIEASDGLEALAKARSSACHMIVTDINMPNMDGLDFIREVRKLPAYQGVPIISSRRNLTRISSWKPRRLALPLGSPSPSPRSN